MIKELYIKNIALISEARIEFDKGLNVLSGETGSGKSVILESINFVLGSKADRSMIRYGENEALVRAVFHVDENSEAVKKLEEYDLDSDETIIISRKLTSDGKSVSKINGTTVTATMLKNITQSLVDVHGQSEHFYLLSEENQLKVIDSLNDKIPSIKAQLGDIIAKKNGYKKTVASLGGDEGERARRLDLLSFQINEIESADLKIGEYDELKTRRALAINAEKILLALNTAKSSLSEDGGCSDSLSAAMHAVNSIANLSDDYDKLSVRLESVYSELDDISEIISDLSESLNFDADEAKRIEDRLGVLNSLRKKYGQDEEEVLSFKDKAKKEYEALLDSESIIKECTLQIEACNDKIYKLCKELTNLRKSSSEVLCKSVINELKTLNIPNADFSVAFKDYDFDTANLNSSNGSDEMRFEFSANKGEPLKPLNKVISGGEMSRFMLAVKSQLKDLNGISSYIFDEIDSGISGYTAITVANKFIEISKSTQIIAVSHLPQVCAASDAQYLIYKKEENGKTLSFVKRLSLDEKIQELVRLTGSVSSEAATLHAEELIAQFKKNTK